MGDGFVCPTCFCEYPSRSKRDVCYRGHCDIIDNLKSFEGGVTRW